MKLFAGVTSSETSSSFSSQPLGSCLSISLPSLNFSDCRSESLEQQWGQHSPFSYFFYNFFIFYADFICDAIALFFFFAASSSLLADYFFNYPFL